MRIIVVAFIKILIQHGTQFRDKKSIRAVTLTTIFFVTYRSIHQISIVNDFWPTSIKINRLPSALSVDARSLPPDQQLLRTPFESRCQNKPNNYFFHCLILRSGGKDRQHFFQKPQQCRVADVYLKGTIGLWDTTQHVLRLKTLCAEIELLKAIDFELSSEPAGWKT